MKLYKWWCYVNEHSRSALWTFDVLFGWSSIFVQELGVVVVFERWERVNTRKQHHSSYLSQSVDQRNPETMLKSCCGLRALGKGPNKDILLLEVYAYVVYCIFFVYYSRLKLAKLFPNWFTTCKAQKRNITISQQHSKRSPKCLLHSDLQPVTIPVSQIIGNR